MKKSYKERQDAFVIAYDVRQGTKFRVKRKSFDNEDGWANNWPPDMNKTVGKIVEVHAHAYTSSGIMMKGGFSYPFFVLEHISNPRTHSSVRVELNDKHTAVVGKDKIFVGCQTFKTDIIKKLQDALDEVTPKKKEKVKSKRKK